MTIADFPDRPDDDAADLAGLDFELPADFVVPDDLSELDDMPPATHHEDPDGTQWDEPEWLANAEPGAERGGLGDAQQVSPVLPGGLDSEPALANDVAALGAEIDASFSADIDAELAEMTGEHCELALLLTPVADARALVAACVLVGVPVTVVPSPSGAVAVLVNKDGDGPERAAAALAAILPAFPVLLITKASGQLKGRRYLGSQPPQEVPAGLLVAGASGVVEDLIIGQRTPVDIPGTVSSSGVTEAKAMLWLSKAARHRRSR